MYCGYVHDEVTCVSSHPKKGSQMCLTQPFMNCRLPALGETKPILETRKKGINFTLVPTPPHIPDGFVSPWIFVLLGES